MNVYHHNNFLFTDVESTGFAKSGPHTQPDQARVCQLALVLTDASGAIKSQFSALIKPNGWEIGASAFDTHGISTEDCDKYGLPFNVVMHNYYWFMYQADLVIAHNINFEKRMFEIEEAFHNEITGENLPNVQSKKQWYCTQEKSKNVCRIPPTDKMRRAKRNGFKTPNLQEALFKLTGKRMVNAHDAMEDTLACKDVFFALNPAKVKQNV